MTRVDFEESGVVPLTREHLIEWFGDDGEYPTFKGVAGVLNGELKAVAGVRIIRGQVVLFADFKDEAFEFKHIIHRYAMKFFNKVSKEHKRIFALQDKNLETSERWLIRLGFKPYEGDVWLWQR